MREFAKISPQVFWCSKSGRDIRALGVEALAVALYLLTSPGSNMIGLYYLPLVLASHEVGLAPDKTLEMLKALQGIGFCSYDESTEMVWVHDMVSSQVGAPRDGDKRLKGVQNQYEAAPQSFLLSEFYDKYRAMYSLPVRRGSNGASPSDAPSKGLGSKEKKKEKEKELMPVAGPLVCTLPLIRPTRWAAALAEVNDHYRKEHPRAAVRLDAEKGTGKKVVERFIAGFTPQDVCKGIDGNHLSPYHRGENDSKTKYHSLELIVRSDDKLQGFIELAEQHHAASEVAETPSIPSDVQGLFVAAGVGQLSSEQEAVLLARAPPPDALEVAIKEAMQDDEASFDGVMQRLEVACH